MGQPPYAPGENNRLKWVTQGNLGSALTREAGGKKPLLVLVYSSSHAKDCCASNFERSVLRYKPVLDVAAGFQAFKFQKEGKVSPEIEDRFELDKKKPALLLFDAEGGLLHKQQKCIDPKKYAKILKSALSLNNKRMKLRQRYLAERREVRGSMEAGEYAKALRSVDKMLKKRNELAGSVLTLVEGDRAEIESIAQEMFDKASDLRSKNERLQAYELFKEIRDEFRKLQSVGKDAKQSCRELRAELKKLGVEVH